MMLILMLMLLLCPDGTCRLKFRDKHKRKKVMDQHLSINISVEKSEG